TLRVGRPVAEILRPAGGLDHAERRRAAAARVQVDELAGFQGREHLSGEIWLRDRGLLSSLSGRLCLFCIIAFPCPAADSRGADAGGGSGAGSGAGSERSSSASGAPACSGWRPSPRPSPTPTAGSRRACRA